MLLKFALFYIFTSSLFFPQCFGGACLFFFVLVFFFSFLFLLRCVFTLSLCNWEDFAVTLIVYDFFQRNDSPVRIVYVKKCSNV